MTGRTGMPTCPPLQAAPGSQKRSAASACRARSQSRPQINLRLEKVGASLPLQLYDPLCGSAHTVSSLPADLHVP